MMAEAVGIKGVRIEDPAEVEGKLAEALAHPGPVVVDAVVEPDGAGDAAQGHSADGEGFHAVHVARGPKRAR